MYLISFLAFCGFHSCVGFPCLRCSAFPSSSPPLWNIRLILSFRLNLVFNGPIFFEPLICRGLMIVPLLISCLVLRNASFTRLQDHPVRPDVRPVEVGQFFCLFLPEYCRTDWQVVMTNDTNMKST